MKKFIFLGLVVVLLAFSAAPVLAAGPNNGHGNGNSAGQSNANGDQDRQQDRIHSNHAHTKNNVSVLANSVHGMRKPFYLQGTILSVGSGAMTLTIDVSHGNARVKQFIGGTGLLVTAELTTRIFKITQGAETQGSESAAPSTSSSDAVVSNNPHAITFGDLHTGDMVAIHGLVVGEAFTATKITVFTQGIGGLPEAGQP
jgi:hypothetical protein